MKKEITNTASEGLNLDLHPIVTPNSVLTDNLNGTMITYNGNEFSLQNDKGNSLKAKLSDGFVPIGIKERNGVLYIVSVHQIDEDNWETEIGTYPGLDWKIQHEEWTDFEKNPPYTPLKNFNDGNNFRTTKLEFTTETPLDIEIQDSYDGSVNLIISDKQHNPILINSGFSVNGNQYKINNTDIKYSDNDFEVTSKLIKTVPSFMKFDFGSVSTGGQLKGGNYTFYAYLGDSDGNTTDIAAESGIISIFKGDINSPKSISGTLADERTDKLIELTLYDIPSGYNKVYLSYVREYSDTAGYLMTEAARLTESYDITGQNNIDIIINGYEEEKSISIEQLNINYLPISSYKTATQQQSMLFIGNVNQNTELKYKDLQSFAHQVKIRLNSNSDIVDRVSEFDYNLGEYYDPKNIYNYVGYWPGEYYRFGIVFIKSDGGLTPVFPTYGGLLKFGEYLDINSEHFNEKGVIKLPDEDEHLIIGWDRISPWYLEFDCSGMEKEITNSKMADLIKGFFIVRQKRIPEAICQGLQVHLDSRTHVPVMPWKIINANKSGYFLESFLIQYDNIDWSNATLEDLGKIILKYGTINPVGRLTYNPESADGGLLASAVNKYYAKVRVYYPIKNWWQSGSPALYTAQKDNYLDVYVLLDYSEQNSNPIRSITETKNDQYKIGYTVKAGFDKKVAYKWLDFTNYNNSRPNWYWLFKDVNEVKKYIFDPSYNKNFLEKCNSYFKENKLITEFDDSTINDFSLRLIQAEASSDSFGILSQETVLDPSIRNRFDGSSFQLNTICELENSNYNQNNIQRRIILDNIFPANSIISNDNVNAVWIKENTKSKVVNNCVFSNVIGSAENIQDFKTVIINNEDDINNKRLKLVRGLFTPYIGVTLPYKDNAEESFRIVQLSSRINPSDAFTIRGEDNSPFYAVSNRYSLADNSCHYIDVYRGDCYTTTQTVRINRNFIDPNYPYADNIITPDCWFKHYLHDPTKDEFEAKEYASGNKTAWDEINSTDVNTVSLGHWVTFKCLASSNLGLRSEDPFDSKMTADFGPRSFFPKVGSTATADKQEESTLLNAGYGISVGRKRYQVMQDIPYVNQEYSNRVMFSNIDVQSEFINGYRIFQGESYKDYDKQYGPIVKLVAWDNNIVCVFEHGIGLIGVNQQALMQTTTEQTIHIYGHGVLSDQMTIISQDYGTKYADSVVKTPIGIYGIDTDAKKIWRFSNKQGFETLSDMKIETFLNNNLVASYNIDVDTIDVRTHYNSFKGDVIFTWYEPYTENTRRVCSICFNERQSLWITRYNWVPIVSENANGEFYSLQRGEDSNKQVGIYHHDPKQSSPTKWYGKQEPFEFEFVVSDPIGVNKIFENLMIVSNNVQPEELQFEFIGDSYFFNKTRIYHTVFENKFSDKRYFGNEITRNLKLYKSDPSRDKDIVVFNKPNLAWNLQEHDYKPFRNASILNDRNNVPLFGQIIETDNATKEYRLVIPQECRNIETWGRRLGNMHYKEGIWRTTIEPILYDARLNDPIITLFTTPATKWNSARIRDKWCKIRIRYSGEDLAVITAIKTIVNI